MTRELPSPWLNGAIYQTFGVCARTVVEAHSRRNRVALNKRFKQCRESAAELAR
jgi:hypothetical protein